MKTKLLGDSDLSLTPIGVGAWAMGGPDWAFGWGNQDDKDSADAIRAALDAGLNWIDTAAVYGRNFRKSKAPCPRKSLSSSSEKKMPRLTIGPGITYPHVANNYNDRRKFKISCCTSAGCASNLSMT